MRILVIVALVAGCSNSNNPSCPSPFKTCGTTCTATQADPANCGTCGNACPAGQTCVAGACTISCPAGSQQCGTSCVSTATDNQNCGACNKKCANGEMCSNGACAPTCAAGYMTCTDYCADVTNDSQNCGSCGKVCDAGQRCASGSCTASCAAGHTACNGGCVDTTSDPANCGACGNACLLGEVCQAGACACGITGLSGGHYTTCGVRSDGKVVCTSAFNAAKCWGGQNLDGTTGSGCGGSFNVGNVTPWVIPGLSSVASFSSGGDFGCALKTDGTVWCLGSNLNGKLGDGEAVPSPKAFPVQVMLSPSPSPSPLTGVKQIAAGGDHACALTNGGDVYCWGTGGNGQLGTGNTDNSPWAMKATLTGVSNVKKISCGRNTSFAIAGDGTLWCWGANGGHECGSDPADDTLTPIQVPTLSNVASVSGTEHTFCALSSDQTVHCWGANEDGQTSVSPATQSQVPSPSPVPLANVTEIAVGYRHSCARNASGGVFCWGRNMNGQIGDGTIDFAPAGSSATQHPSPSPTAVRLPDGTALVAKSIAASHQTSCAVVGASDHPYCWGMNKKGQAGIAEVASGYPRPILSCGY